MFIPFENNIYRNSFYINRTGIKEVTLLWMYKELYSCPLVIILGSFNYDDLTGLVTLPVLNFRLNILLSQNNETRVIHNLPRRSWYEQLHRVCISIYSDNLKHLNNYEKVIAASMFYGGFGLYALIEDKVSILSLDFVNKKHYYFYILPSDLSFSKLKEVRLEDWIVVQFALREGINKLLYNICSKSFEKGAPCEINTSHGLLRISDKNISEDNWIRIFPDNAPLRHVVSTV